MPNFAALWQTWKGALKFTSEHAKFVAKVHPSYRRDALFDYWIGRISSFLLILGAYYTFVKFLIADEPAAGQGTSKHTTYTSDEQPFTAFDHKWNRTKYFHGFLMAAAVLLWLLILKGDFVEDSRLLKLPNAMPPRFPFLAHGQVFWRDYIRSPAMRAWHRLETITMAAQATYNDCGLTRYWLRPWGPPIVYVTSPESLRQLFMLEEYSEVYVGGQACSCMPKVLWSCGYGHPLSTLKSLLLKRDVVAHDKLCVSRHADRLAHHVRKLCCDANGKRPKHKHESVDVDIVGVVGEMVLDSICEFVLGIDFRPGPDIRNAFDEACDGAAAIFSAPPPAYPFPPWIWRYASAEGQSIHRNAALIRDCVAEEVAKALKKSKINMNSGTKSLSRKSLLDCVILTAEGQCITENELTEDLTAFMLQRYSVMVPAVIWTLKEVLRARRGGSRPGYILPDLIKQSKAAEAKTSLTANTDRPRLDNVLAAGSQKSTSDGMLHTNCIGDVAMPILDRCVREALRLNPPAPALAPLTLLKDVRFSGYKIRKGTELRVMPYAVQRSGKYWGAGKELKFDESNWKFASVQAHRPFQHLVFGAGALSCASPERLRWAVRVFSWVLLREFHLHSPETILGTQDNRDSSGTALPPSRISILLPRNGMVAKVKLR